MTIVHFLCHIFKNDVNLSVDNMQNEIDNVESWSIQHDISLNAKKSKLLIFKKKHFDSCEVSNCFPNIPAVDNLKLFGVVFTPNLSWTEHFNYVIKIVSPRLYILRTLRDL